MTVEAPHPHQEWLDTINKARCLESEDLKDSQLQVYVDLLNDPHNYHKHVFWLIGQTQREAIQAAAEKFDKGDFGKQPYFNWGPQGGASEGRRV